MNKPANRPCGPWGAISLYAFGLICGILLSIGIWAWSKHHGASAVELEAGDGASINEEIRAESGKITAMELKWSGQAISGDLQSALNLYNSYTYGHRNYPIAFFWATIAEENGADTSLGSLKEAAMNSAEIDIREALKRTESDSLSNRKSRPSRELPPLQ